MPFAFEVPDGSGVGGAAGVVLQVALFVVGLLVAILASGKAVNYARALAARLGAPAFVVGVVLVAIGTDLPEIANSIVAHIEGEGDINVGDSIGSTLTQYTLVLGILPLVAAVIYIDRKSVVLVSALTMVGLGLTTVFVADGWLGRWEGGVLVLTWALATVAVIRFLPHLAAEDPPEVKQQRPLFQVVVVLASLLIVGVGATVSVRALINLAETAGVPQFVLAFFGASIGTSAPEIVVDVTALLRGAPGIALGDALGSSMVDATLSIGAGPIVAPAAVTASLAITAALYTLGAVALVGALLGTRRRHDRPSAAALIALYAVSYAVILATD